MADRDSKACTKCGEVKPATGEHFHVARLGLFGFQAVCKPCVKAYSASKYREKNPKKPPRVEPKSKACTSCGAVKPKEHFHFANKSKNDLRTTKCIECHKVLMRQIAARNRERAKVSPAAPEKRCPACGNTKPKSAFSPNSSIKDGLSAHCRECAKSWTLAAGKKRYAEDPALGRALNRMYRERDLERTRAVRKAAKARHLERNPGINRFYAYVRYVTKKSAIPPWADLDAIAAVYREAARLQELDGVPRHVDHIVPLRGKNVCGLHVETNLRILTASENLAKGSTFEVQ